jgi:hypothetical protein
VNVRQLQDNRGTMNGFGSTPNNIVLGNRFKATTFDF